MTIIVKPSKRISDIFILGSVALFSCLLFVVFSSRFEGLGFPLDDAWIHHTFARNFADYFQWAYRPGELSGGSTGPAWGFLLSLLYFLDVQPVIGTLIFGFLLLWAVAYSGTCLVTKILPDQRLISLGSGILLALEWHLVWAALSGMETILLILISLIVFNQILSRERRWLLIGILIGISVWVRPDGLTLLGPALFAVPFLEDSPKKIIRATFLIFGGIVILGSAYFVFNWVVAGDLWPNTFYAKQAEYAAWRELPLIKRIVNVGKQGLIGVGILLLPGMILAGYLLAKQRKWEYFGAIIWAVGYIGLYAWRLPVDYQHGRYIIPALPILYLIGAAGLGFAVRAELPGDLNRIIRKVWLISTGIVAVVFLGLGAKSYALDVAVINTELVQTSRWIDENLDEDALIAAHDIGALGYFSKREIIDLAGLVTPDVIPFIRDENQLRTYLDKEEPDYLMTYPDWYPDLSADLKVIYKSSGAYTALFEMENMVVFIWK